MGLARRAGAVRPVLDPVMDKRAYKTQMTYPIPNTAKIDGQCCQPFGRTTILWGAGKEYPGAGRGLLVPAVPQEELLCVLV